MIRKESFTKKQKREFDRLDKKDKEKVIEVAVEQTISNAFGNKIAESINVGLELQMHWLYEKYVQKMDSVTAHSDEWNLLVESMLSDIRVAQISYEKRNAIENGAQNE